MKKIICFSDTHGKHHKMTDWFLKNPADILIFAGDYQFNDMDFGIDFISWFASLPYKQKVMTFGNHDGNFDIVTNEVFSHYKEITVLNHKYSEVLGIKFFGTPYSLHFSTWSFMEDEERLAELYAQIPDDIEILVTHSPASGILDETTRKNRAGSVSLLDRIKQLKNLKLVVCGHIHEARGMKVVDGVTYVNCATVDRQYAQLHDPIIVEFE